MTAPALILIEQDVGILINNYDDPINEFWIADGNTYYMDLDRIPWKAQTIGGIRREIVSVRAANVELAWAFGGFQHVNTVNNSWYYGRDDNSVFINLLSSTHPDELLVLIRFRLYWSNVSYHFNGEFYEGRAILEEGNPLTRTAVNSETYSNEPVSGGEFSLINGIDSLVGSVQFQSLFGILDYSIDYLHRNYIIPGQRVKISRLLNNTLTVLRTGLIHSYERTDRIVKYALFR